MISDFLPRVMISSCDDDGIYYIRQLDAADGDLGFEGMVWFGQHFDEQPLWANVFIGRLRRGARTDENGHRVDFWEGRFFDVPKGRICGGGPVNLESFTVDVRDQPGCDFLEHYLIKGSGPGFGGRVWGLSSSPCWRIMFNLGRTIVRPPAIPDRIAAATSRNGNSIDIAASLADDLSSASVSPGFERAAPNLTGLWRGNDGGSYYITETQDSGDVVWYSEHPTARPSVGGLAPIAAVGWSNVFWGERNGTVISGLWADVPRAATNGAGRLQLAVDGGNRLRITGVTGGFGGRMLRRVVARDVSVQVESVTVEDYQEDSDEATIYLFFFKLDGDSVDIDSLSSSTATVSPRPEILMNGMTTGTTRAVPVDQGVYSTFLTNMRSNDERDTSSDTRIGVIAYVLERDRGTRGSFREVRHDDWMRSQAWVLNSSLRRDELPSRDSLRTHSRRILTQFRWGDTDDHLGGDVDVVTLHDLVNNPSIERSIVVDGDGGRYRLHIRYTANNQRNSSCS